MKNEISLPAIPFTFCNQYLIFSCILTTIKVEDVSTNFSRIQLFRFILCGTIVERTQSTQTKHADCPQFNTDVRQQYSGHDNNISHCIVGATYRYNRLWFKWTNITFGFGRQLPIIPPSLNYLNLPPNPFHILATMAVAKPTAEGHDENYRIQSPEPSEPSPISTPPINLSTIEGWETPHTTTDDNTFYSDDEPRRI